VVSNASRSRYLERDRDAVEQLHGSQSSQVSRSGGTPGSSRDDRMWPRWFGQPRCEPLLEQPSRHDVIHDRGAHHTTLFADIIPSYERHNNNMVWSDVAATAEDAGHLSSTTEVQSTTQVD
jgi:hypothetical protein